MSGTEVSDEIDKFVESQPLVGPRVATSTASHLASAINDANSALGPALTWVAGRYRDTRSVRGDGSCFYRALMFSLCEQLVKPENRDELNRLTTFLELESLPYLERAGYELVAVETFQEMLVEFFQELQTKTAEDVEQVFKSKGETEAVVWFARLLCAAFMKNNAERFLPFLAGEHATVEAYCSAEVEPQHKECEEPQIIAISELLRIAVSVVYTSAKSKEGVISNFGEGKLKLVFLYRPGHYDILYE